MLKIGILDANQNASVQYHGIVSSVIGGWLEWEMKKAGVVKSDLSEADVVFLIFAGSIDWRSSCNGALRSNKISANPDKRNGKPYIITGGAVDAIPFLALSIADCLAVGESYLFVRELLAGIVGGWDVSMLKSWAIEYPHCIERSQIAELERDKYAPWLLQSEAPAIATPDNWVDWDTPPVRSDDKVIRIIAEKGCHKKCVFCATTFRQKHVQNLNETAVRGMLHKLKLAGERVQLVSNDPMNLPYFTRITTKLDSQSFTIQEVSDPKNRQRIIQSKVGIARFGVEGVSERMRKAFAKPISNDHLFDVITDLHSNHVQTHMFFISGAPYETADDYEELKAFFFRLALKLDWSLCRIKFTTFLPCPPAPLARFVSGKAIVDLFSVFDTYRLDNIAARRLLVISGRKKKNHINEIADQLQVERSVVEEIYYSNAVTDLYPTLADAKRVTYEVIRWPLSVETRYKISSVYQQRMNKPYVREANVHETVS